MPSARAGLQPNPPSAGSLWCALPDNAPHRIPLLFDARCRRPRLRDRDRRWVSGFVLPRFIHRLRQMADQMLFEIGQVALGKATGEERGKVCELEQAETTRGDCRSVARSRDQVTLHIPFEVASRALRLSPERSGAATRRCRSSPGAGRSGESPARQRGRSPTAGAACGEPPAVARVPVCRIRPPSAHEHGQRSRPAPLGHPSQTQNG